MVVQTGDTAFTLEATHIVDGKVERELKPLTMQEVSRITMKHPMHSRVSLCGQ